MLPKGSTGSRAQRIARSGQRMELSPDIFDINAIGAEVTHIPHGSNQSRERSGVKMKTAPNR